MARKGLDGVSVDSTVFAFVTRNKKCELRLAYCYRLRCEKVMDIYVDENCI